MRVEATSVSNSFKMSGCKGVERDQEDRERDERSKYGLFTKRKKLLPYLNSNRMYQKENGNNSLSKVPKKMVEDETQSSGREIILKQKKGDVLIYSRRK